MTFTSTDFLLTLACILLYRISSQLATPLAAPPQQPQPPTQNYITFNAGGPEFHPFDPDGHNPDDPDSEGEEWKQGSPNWN